MSSDPIASRFLSMAPTCTQPQGRSASTSTTSASSGNLKAAVLCCARSTTRQSVEDQEYSSLRPLTDWLSYNGYTVVTKAVKEFTDASGRRKVKGNMDVELAVDAMELAGQIDQMVLFSGDGAFRSLVEAVQRRGVRVTVISTISSQPPMIADELRRQADVFTDLAELRSKLAATLPGARIARRPFAGGRSIEHVMTTCCRRPGRCRRHRHRGTGDLYRSAEKALGDGFHKHRHRGRRDGHRKSRGPPRKKQYRIPMQRQLPSLAQHASDGLMIA